MRHCTLCLRTLNNNAALYTVSQNTVNNIAALYAVSQNTKQ